MEIQKTNAMRLLKALKIEYTPLTYNTTDGLLDGVSVAKKTGKNPNEVFKTLVCMGPAKEIFVFCIPVNIELDLKKAAKAANQKSIEMLASADLLKITGYKKGGCSPLGMKKPYATFLHGSAMKFDEIVVSGGKIGVQISLLPKSLLKATNANWFAE